MLISIFIPFYNEEDILQKNVHKIVEAFKKYRYEFELFLIDDHSNDHSPEIAKQLSNEKIHYIRYEIGPTRRENLAQSFQLAHGDIIAFMDVDLATNLVCLSDLFEGIIEGYDIVIGDRYHPLSKIKRKLWRIVVSIVYNTCISLLFHTNIRDHECGFKSFKRNVILQLVEDLGFDNTFKRGISWDAELLIRARKQGYKIKIIPLVWKERKKTALYFSREIKMIPYLLRLKMRLRNKTVKH